MACYPLAMAAEPHPGLCATCVNARRIESDRGSVFYLCELALRDDRYAKYPRLPVRECEGYEVKNAVG